MFCLSKTPDSTRSYDENLKMVSHSRFSCIARFDRAGMLKRRQVHNQHFDHSICR